ASPRRSACSSPCAHSTNDPCGSHHETAASDCDQGYQCLSPRRQYFEFATGGPAGCGHTHGPGCIGTGLGRVSGSNRDTEEESAGEEATVHTSTNLPATFDFGKKTSFYRGCLSVLQRLA